jgi:hypothetical protein
LNSKPRLGQGCKKGNHPETGKTINGEEEQEMRKSQIRAFLPCALVLAFISAQIFILLYLRSRAGHPSMLPDEASEPRAGKRRQARLEGEILNFNLKDRSYNGEEMDIHQNALAVPPSIISMAPSANSTTTTSSSSSSSSLSPMGNLNRSQVCAIMREIGGIATHFATDPGAEGELHATLVINFSNLAQTGQWCVHRSHL